MAVSGRTFRLRKVVVSRIDKSACRSKKNVWLDIRALGDSETLGQGSQSGLPATEQEYTNCRTVSPYPLRDVSGRRAVQS
jgi:hypothetical protein